MRTTLRERFESKMDPWHAIDEFSSSERHNFLDDLEDAVKDWLRDFEYPSPLDAPEPKPQVEYQLINCDKSPDSVQRALNALAKEGWCVVGSFKESHFFTQIIMERELR